MSYASKSIKARKIVLFLGSVFGTIAVIRALPLLSLGKFGVVSAISQISGTLAGFSVPWLLPVFGIFALVGIDRDEHRDFSGWYRGGSFSGSFKTGEIIPGNPELAGWLSTYWMLIYPMFKFYHDCIRFSFLKALGGLLGTSDSALLAVTISDILVGFSPIVIAVIVAGKVWHSECVFCIFILRFWFFLILAATVNITVYWGFRLLI